MKTNRDIASERCCGTHDDVINVVDEDLDNQAAKAMKQCRFLVQVSIKAIASISMHGRGELGCRSWRDSPLGTAQLTSSTF